MGDQLNGPDSTQKDQTVGELRCQEYCNGSSATWYCPQCSAIFCESCYNKEHKGNKRKANHLQLSSVRPICNEHKLTLDFFDWTSLSPLCVTCKENLTESSEHLVDRIELVLPKLRRLVTEKLEKSRLLYKRTNNSFAYTDIEADKTATRAFEQLRYCFQEARKILDRREAIMQKKIKRLCESFKSSPERAYVHTQLGVLKQLICEGEALLNKEPGEFAGEFTSFYSQFNSVYMSLDECKPPKAFRLNITLEKKTLQQINNLGEVTAAEPQTDNQGETTSDKTIVGQSQTMAPSPLLLSTAKALTLLGQTVPLDGADATEKSIRQSTVVSTAELTGQVPTNTDLFVGRREPFSCDGGPVKLGTANQVLTCNAISVESGTVGTSGTTFAQGTSEKTLISSESGQSSGLQMTVTSQLESRAASHVNGTFQQVTNPTHLDMSSLGQRQVECTPLGNTQVIRSQSMQTQICNGASYELSPEFGYPQHRQTNQDRSPEFPPVHRKPTARKCIEEQFANIVDPPTEQSSRPESNSAVESKKQESSKRLKSKQTDLVGTQSPEKTRHFSQKRAATPKMAVEESRGSFSSCKRRRRCDELSREFIKCDEILTEMWASEDSVPFVHPVDKKKFPDYYTKVKRPMDMTYIKEKLHALCYESIVDFVNDVQLIFKNCHSYNPPKSFTAEAATRLEDLFGKLMKTRFPNFHEIFPDNSLNSS